MTDGQVLGLITARGGSKGIPCKNIRPIGGKPMIGWTIEAALNARHIDRVIVSSDDEQILSVAREYGAETPFIRPANLAEDTTSSIDVVLHALDELPGYEWLVLLQPTSPFRTAADIDAAIEHCNALSAPACVSVCPTKDSPWWSFTLSDEQRLSPLLDTSNMPMRRQDLPDIYKLNGAVYVARTDWFRQQRSFLTKETVAFAMPAEHSVDIDTPLDLAIAECLMNQALPQNTR